MAGTAQDQSAVQALHAVTLLHAVIAVAVFVIGPLLSVLAVLFLLRRFTARNGPLVRVEFVSNGQELTLVRPTAPTTVESHRVVLPEPVPLAPDAREQPSTAQRFDLGPTYEEELQIREQSGRQQDDATLRHIFEENLKLREQIDALPNVQDEPIVD